MEKGVLYQTVDTVTSVGTVVTLSMDKWDVLKESWECEVEA